MSKSFISETTSFHYFPQRNPKKSKKFGHWTLGSVAKRRLNRVNKLRKKKIQNLFFAVAILHPNIQKFFLNLIPLFSITFPQGFRKSKQFGHWTLRNGGKKTVKRSDKHRYQKVRLSKAKFAHKLIFFSR